MNFTYRARDETGAEVYGELEAHSLAEAERMLRMDDLDPLEVMPAERLTRPEEAAAGFTEVRSDRGTGMAAGCLSGWVFGVFLIIAGVALTFTGIGAVIGVPLILIGLVLPFIAPFVGLNAVRGPCPYCGAQVRSSRTDAGVTCPVCRHRILIRDGRYYRVL